MSASDLSTSTRLLPGDADGTETEESGGMSLLWLPYVILTLILLAMAFTSFLHYHINNKSRYSSTTKVQQTPRPLKHVPIKYRVTMSRSGAIRPVDFNILDIASKIGDQYDSNPEVESDTEYDNQRSPDGPNCVTVLPVSSSHDVLHDHVTVLPMSHDELQNHVTVLTSSHDGSGSPVTVLSLSSQNGILNPAMGFPTSSHKDMSSAAALVTKPPSDRSEPHIPHAQSIIQKALPASREAYLNEGYDSNCDSDKSLISQKDIQRSQEELGFHNRSFDSTESFSTSDPDKGIQTLAIDMQGSSSAYPGRSSHSAKPKLDPSLDAVYYHNKRGLTEPDILIHTGGKAKSELSHKKPAVKIGYVESAHSKKPHSSGKQKTKSSLEEAIDIYSEPQC